MPLSKKSSMVLVLHTCFGTADDTTYRKAVYSRMQDVIFFFDMDFHVFREITLWEKGISTAGARKRSVTHMNQSVIIQSMFLWKGLLTLITFVGFFSGVYSHVEPQLTIWEKRFLTFCALVIFLSSMKLMVPSQTFFIGERFIALKTFKMLWIQVMFSCMNSSQVKATGKWKIASFTVEGFLFLFVNYFNMTLQSFCRCEKCEEGSLGIWWQIWWQIRHQIWW